MLLKHLIIKPFDLLNTVPLTRTMLKTVNKQVLTQALIFEIVILKTNGKDYKSRKI